MAAGDLVLRRQVDPELRRKRAEQSRRRNRKRGVTRELALSDPRVRMV